MIRNKNPESTVQCWSRNDKRRETAADSVYGNEARDLLIRKQKISKKERDETPSEKKESL